MELIRGFERTPEAEAAFAAFAGQFDTGTTFAERLGTPKVMTIDQRHFNVVRPRHVDAFELLP